MTTPKRAASWEGSPAQSLPTDSSVVPLLVHRGRASKWVRGWRGLRGDSPRIGWKEVAAGKHSTHLHPHTQQATRTNLWGLGLGGRGKAVWTHWAEIKARHYSCFFMDLVKRTANGLLFLGFSFSWEEPKVKDMK